MSRWKYDVFLSHHSDDKLADERLIVTEDEFVEIAHEALIRDWKEIARWIDADRTGLRIQRRLTEAASHRLKILARVAGAVAVVAFGEEWNTLRSALGLASDPVARTRFIHHYALFRGGLRDAARALESVTTDPDPAAADFRSGLCAAPGQIPWDDMQPEDQETLRATMLALYRESPDGGTHSAAYYALNRWEQQATISRLPETRKPWTDRGWAVNSLGITMVQIAAGTFWMGDDSGHPT